MRRPFPPVPIPEDMLDPLTLNGVQPSPYDTRYKNRFGQVFTLGPIESSGIKAQSEYLSEWVVKLLPPNDTIANIAGDNTFAFTAIVMGGYDAEQFTEYELTNVAGQVAIPLVGIALGVHGRLIQLAIARNSPSSTIKLSVQGAIVPGRPSLSNLNMPLTVPAGDTVTSGIPHFATKFWINGTVAAGDTLLQIGPGGTTVQSIVLLAGQVGPFPIHPGAIAIRYGSAAAKIIVAGYEVIS